MLAPAAAAIRARIEHRSEPTFTEDGEPILTEDGSPVLTEGFWPSTPRLKWPNENWGDTNPQDNADPFVEVKIIGGRNSIEAFSRPGNRLFIHPGVIRFYICVPQGTGTDDAMTIADQLAAFMERAEFGQANGQTVRTRDFSVYDDVATHEDGNYFVLMCSVPFEFFYTA